MGVETQGWDNSKVSINKRNGDSSGSMPAQPHINNEVAEPEWRRGLGSRPHCPGQGTNTPTPQGHRNHRGQKPHPLPSKVPEILWVAGQAGALYHSPAQVKSVSSISIKTAGSGAGTCITPLL